MHDSHIHLALEPLKSNLNEIISRFRENNGKYILTQGTDITDFDNSIEIASHFQDTVQLALGLHPSYFEENTIEKGIYEDIYEKSMKDIEKLEKIILKNKSKIVAIGETGLDYYQMSLNKEISEDIKEQLKEIQKISFRKQLQMAKALNLPLSIHARDIQGSKLCVEDALRIIAEEGKGLVTGSFHSYTGEIDLVEDILDMGFCIGFNGILTYNSGENIREILKKVPEENILFETDGPFLPPQSVRKDKKITEKFAEPFHVKEIISVASEVKSLDPKYLEEVTDRNYERVFFKQND
jgi:TatD DNase family protein